MLFKIIIKMDYYINSYLTYDEYVSECSIIYRVLDNILDNTRILDDNINFKWDWNFKITLPVQTVVVLE